ncbi:MAG: PQQ-dependent sugar dehydrogenase, partial [Chloroflexota bacterium]
MRYFAPLFLLLLMIIDSAPNVLAAQDVSCDARPTRLDQPWMRTGLSCLEEVINDPDAGELAFTALVTAPDGTLYAARPLSGEVFAFTDTDGDGLPESPQVVADGLTLPNALAYDKGALFIAGGSHIYRLRDGELETLVDDLPSGGGFWTGGLMVGGAGQLYVATGAPCDFCDPDDPARGAILQYAPDGSSREIVATGLRQPADLAVRGSDAWVLDSAPSGWFDTPDLDELNHIQYNSDFGFPYCIGRENTPALDGANCSNVTAPVVTFPTGSTPSGIAAYRGDAIPALEGKLLVVLSGAYNDLDLRGYQVVAADPQTGSYEALMPASPDVLGADFTVEEMNYRGIAQAIAATGFE